MTTAMLDEHVRALRDRVPYLDGCITSASAPWIACSSLLESDGILAELLGDDRRSRGVKDLPVAASMFFQGQATRVLGVAAGVWLTTGVIPDVAASATAITLEYELPAQIGFTQVACAAISGTAEVEVECTDERALLEWFTSRAFAQHLEPLADAITACVPIGRRLLWGNAAAALANACHSVEAGADAEERGAIAAATDRFIAAMPHDLDGLGQRFTPAGDPAARSFWERDACCLWFREDPTGAVCDSCSLISVEERRRRLTTAAAR